MERNSSAEPLQTAARYGCYMSKDTVAEQLHAELLQIRATLRAGDLTDVQTLVNAYRRNVQLSLQCQDAQVTRAQCLQLHELHVTIQDEIRMRRDQAADWLRQRRRTSAAIQAYNRSARRLFR
jgi:hypothetical protein